MSKTNQKIYLPPIFRLLMELTAWVYFTILALTINLIYILGLVISILLLGVFNFPGDKHKDGPVNIPGWARILNEWFSGGLLSIVGAYLLFQEVGAVLQLILIIITIIIDRQRYAWMLGLKDTAPDYVTALRET